jgi:c-di-GMP-related signal transduction protein
MKGDNHPVSVQAAGPGHAASSTLENLVELVSSPQARVEHVVATICQHEGLAEALVGRANSPEFALRHQISRVEHALAVLGLSRTIDTIIRYETGHRQSAIAAPHFPANPAAAVALRRPGHTA